MKESDILGVIESEAKRGPQGRLNGGQLVPP